MALKVDINRALNDLKNADGLIIGALRRGLLEGVEAYRTYFTKQYLTGRPGLNRRTGTLGRSWFAHPGGDHEDMYVRLRTASKYAKIHEYGGTINSGPDTMLSIPLTAAARKLTSPKQMPGLSLFISAKGNLLLALKTKRSKIKPQFVLKDFVKIPKRTNIVGDFIPVGAGIIHKKLVQRIREAQAQQVKR